MTEEPSPLTDAELVAVREYHLGPGKPGRCADGQRITGDSCAKCGATDNETCGRWVGKAGKHIPRLLATITALQAELAQANAMALQYAEADEDARKQLREKIDELAKLQAPLPAEIAEIEKRMDGGYQGMTMLKAHAAHDDRATLLRLVREQQKRIAMLEGTLELLP